VPKCDNFLKKRKASDSGLGESRSKITEFYETWIKQPKGKKLGRAQAYGPHLETTATHAGKGVPGDARGGEKKKGAGKEPKRVQKKTVAKAQKKS